MITSAKHLVFHGTLVLLFGLMLGAPYGKAINRSAPAHIINSWRIAHQSIPIAALLMFSVAAVLPSLAISPAVSWVISGGLITSTYFFCVSLPLAAITGHRGLTRGKTKLEDVVLFANTAGAWLSVLSALVLVYAAAVSL